MLVNMSAQRFALRLIGHIWPIDYLVEYSGLEPLTSTLPVSRSSQMS